MRGRQRLLELQALDLEIDHLEARRARLESGEELRTLRAEREEAENRVGELRLALDSVGREQRRLESEIESMEQKAKAEERRLYDGSIVNAKELEALQAEIRHLQDRRSRTEDELLDQMVRREDLEPRLAQAEGALAAARERLEETGGDAARELEAIGGELDGKRATRAEVAAAIDGDLLQLYEELRAQKKGVGAAALIDGVCQGCHQQLSAVEVDRLKKAEGIKRCEHCRRILVLG
jgi:hypothetical protein